MNHKKRSAKVNAVSAVFAVIGLIFVFSGIGSGHLYFVGIGIGFFLAIWMLQLFAK